MISNMFTPQFSFINQHVRSCWYSESQMTSANVMIHWPGMIDSESSSVRLLFFSHSVVSDSWDPMDCSPTGSSVCGISQARVWVGCHVLSQGDLPNPETEPVSSALQKILYQWATGWVKNWLQILAWPLIGYMFI